MQKATIDTAHPACYLNLSYHNAARLSIKIYFNYAICDYLNFHERLIHTQVNLPTEMFTFINRAGMNLFFGEI